MTNLTSQDIRSRLSKNNLKVTYQRIVIYEALMKLDHPTAEDIFNYTREKYPGISLATVYKTLDTFEHNGLVIKVQASGEKYRYDANTDSHNHIYCRQTGKIMDYKDDELEDLIYEHLRKKNIDKNFTIDNIQLHITGKLNGSKSRS
jgi:Fur family transcriptional regulator, peroxide stress response regulator